MFALLAGTAGSVDDVRKDQVGCGEVTTMHVNLGVASGVAFTKNVDVPLNYTRVT